MEPQRKATNAESGSKIHLLEEELMLLMEIKNILDGENEIKNRDDDPFVFDHEFYASVSSRIQSVHGMLSKQGWNIDEYFNKKLT